ncbi:hypothetical protein [Sphingopyxis sp. YR583]|uniref:hypothetical protein n=1 Tax=Sphingopyxis sp. YR583 TaxID=1881047 RepID=UPI00115FBDA4|nr:hypothetical protein [Sphingopyxis sp. YR583]
MIVRIGSNLGAAACWSGEGPTGALVEEPREVGEKRIDLLRDLAIGIETRQHCPDLSPRVAVAAAGRKVGPANQPLAKQRIERPLVGFRRGFADRFVEQRSVSSAIIFGKPKIKGLVIAIRDRFDAEGFQQETSIAIGERMKFLNKLPVDFERHGSPEPYFLIFCSLPRPPIRPRYKPSFARRASSC